MDTTYIYAIQNNTINKVRQSKVMEYKQGYFLERYEEVVFDLQNQIKLPANGAFQNKNLYKFYVDSTGEVTAPNDWYDSYLEIDVEVNKKADGTTYAKYILKYGGVQVIETPIVKGRCCN